MDSDSEKRQVVMLLKIGSRVYRADKKSSRLDPKRSLIAAIRSRAKDRPARPRKIAPLQFPRNAETTYARDITSYVTIAIELVRKRLMPSLDRIFAASASFLKGDRADDYAEIISEIFGGIEIEFEKRTKRSARVAACGVAGRVADTSQRELGRYVKSLIGVDVVQSEPWLAPFAELFIESNVGLIKSIPDRLFGEVRSMVEDAAVTGRRPEAFAKDIEERFGVSESRAKLLARDQVGKYNGQLTAARQQRLGIRSFIWRTSQDERVRESHRIKEGQRYEWQDPPHDTGMPGADYQCRCTASPVLDDLAEENPLVE